MGQVMQRGLVKVWDFILITINTFFFVLIRSLLFLYGKNGHKANICNIFSVVVILS